VIELVRGFEARTGQVAGLYIEIKHPTFFLHEGRYVEGGPINVDLGGLLLATLKANGFVDPDRVYIQSFEMASLLSLRDKLREQNLAFPLIQLFGDVFNLFYVAQPYDLVYHSANPTDAYRVYGELATHLPDGINATIQYAHLATPAVLGFMARTYARGIGVAKHNVLPVTVVQAVDVDGDGRALQRTRLAGAVGPILADAHDAGLLLHAYTLRAEEPFLVRDGDRVVPVEEEALRLLRAGVDGFFTDYPAEGLSARALFLEGRGANPG
jgi:glycerophosphoryl diester phosphodiesterase